MKFPPAIASRLGIPAERVGILPAAAIDPARALAPEVDGALTRAVPVGSPLADARSGAQLRIVRVLERVSDDAYRVAIEGRAITVRLAGRHEPGRMLALAFPGPLPELDGGLRISSAARAALAVGTSAPGVDGEGAALEPLVLLIDAPEAAATLADELAGRIVRSGLFYESHLADWAEGRRPRAELEREPQARERANPQAAAESESPGGAASRAVAAGSVAAAGESTPGVPAPLEPLVREQLNVLERHEARFALALPEGRPAQLIVSRERPRPGEPGEDAGAWTTRLRLELPEIGEVHAKLRLAGRSVCLDLEARAEMTDLLADSYGALRARLASLDLNVVHMTVARHG